MLASEQNVEKSRQLCSRVAPRFDVQREVRLTPALAAALLGGLFEHSADLVFTLARSAADASLTSTNP
jgi:hypothetical protein